jgi:hypothetical protein
LPGVPGRRTRFKTPGPGTLIAMPDRSPAGGSEGGFWGSKGVAGAICPIRPNGVFLLVSGGFYPSLYPSLSVGEGRIALKAGRIGDGCRDG